MSVIDWNAQKTRNIKKAASPLIGDIWAEMLAFSAIVRHVGSNEVRLETSDGRTLHMTRNDFTLWPRYKTSDGFWADCLPYVWL